MSAAFLMCSYIFIMHAERERKGRRCVRMIEVESLVKTYGDVPAVDGISFSVQEGEIFAF